MYNQTGYICCAVPDYPCGKSGKCHGPRASEGPQEVEKIFRTLPCMQKLDYELGKPVIEPLQFVVTM